MLKLNGKQLLLGGFHDHWSRADNQNPAVFLAALNFYHYDFVTLMCGPQSDKWLQELAPVFSRNIKLYLGREEMLGWGHVVTVNPTAPPLEGSDPDYRSALRQLRKTCDLVLLAHPQYIAWETLVETGELDKVLDEGLFDGVQLVTDNVGVAGSREAQIIDWYRAREARGHRTAVVGGWDMHLVKAIQGTPSVLYTSEFPPDGHYEAPCSSRTILFAEENTLPAIVTAVKAGQTVVERMPTGELFGPRDLVTFLEDSGYREAIAELDRRRGAVQLKSSALVAGKAGVLTVTQSGTLNVPVTLNQTQAIPAAAGQPTNWPAVPALLERDRAYLPVTWRGEEGQERIWAVEREHPIQLDILPLLDNGEPAIEVLALRPFEGVVELKLEGLAQPIRQVIHGTSRIALPRKPEASIVRYELRATDRNCVSREFEGELTFFGATRFGGHWSDVPKIGVDQARFAGKPGWGSSRPWPGADTYSAQLQFAWEPRALLLRATVRDAVHYQPYQGHYAYNADCLQLAIDPMLRRKDTIGNIYFFNLVLTPGGPELYRTWSPGDEKTESFQPPKDDVSLGGQYLDIQSVDGGLIYDMTLPWSELVPVRPEAGHRMGVYYIMFNNDGTGHLDNLYWPAVGMLSKPKKWGVLTLLG